MVKSPHFLRIFSYWLNFLVIRWQLIISVIVLWLAGLWLKSNYGQDDSNMWLVMKQFLIIIKWVVAGLFAISLLTTAITWLFFVYNVRNKRIRVQINFGESLKAEAGVVPLTVALGGLVVRPLLGTIRARLLFSGRKLSEPVVLDTDIFKKGGISRQGIFGKGNALLHDRGIYDVERIHILFCDMFNLIAIPYPVPFSQQLYTLPKVEEPSNVRAQPNSVEEQKHRIEIPRRVEGEYINYKEFEPGDNIRRIVWKIYAKSGQLVVRMPETKDPYASHLYFYVSYFQGADFRGGIFEKELLNVYKDKARNIFEALEKNGYEVKIPQDQEVPRLSGMSEKKNELFRITAAEWQSDNSPVAFVNPGKVAFVYLPSLVPVEEVELLVRNLPPSVPVLVLKLSEAILSPFKINMKDIFFRPDPHPADQLRKPWLISPFRQRLVKNENAIEAVLQKRGNGWVTSTIDIKDERG